MLETLVGLAEKLPDLSERRNLLRSVMQSTVSVMVGAEAAAIVGSPGALLGYLAECATDMDKLQKLSDFREAVLSFIGKQRADDVQADGLCFDL